MECQQGDVGVVTEPNKKNVNGLEGMVCISSPAEPMESRSVQPVTEPNKRPTLLENPNSLEISPDVKRGAEAKQSDNVPPSALDPIVKVGNVNLDRSQTDTNLEAEERPHAEVKMTPESWFC